jgi:hypothetical protein
MIFLSHTPYERDLQDSLIKKKRKNFTEGNNRKKEIHRVLKSLTPDPSPSEREGGYR